MRVLKIISTLLGSRVSVKAAQDKNKLFSVTRSRNVGHGPFLPLHGLIIFAFYLGGYLSRFLEEVAQQSSHRVTASPAVAAQIYDEGVGLADQLHGGGKRSSGVRVRREIGHIKIANISGQAAGTSDAESIREIKSMRVPFLCWSWGLELREFLAKFHCEMMIVPHGA